MDQDTIAAIATPLGEGGLGAVRISGPEALPLLKSIFLPSFPSAEYLSHQLRLGRIVLGDGRVVDQVTIVFMKAPKTYTGEDVVEVFSHGGTAVLKLILRAVTEKGARLAGRGEFTQRAFLQGKLDLAQAEAVVNLVRAKTEEAVFLAEGQLEGRLSRRIKAQRQALLALLAAIEADLDFSEDLPPLDLVSLGEGVGEGVRQLEKLLETSRTGELVYEGATVAIVGRPNVGKSSLLNALLKQEKAIVTEIPGTTRDLVEGWLDLRGILLRLVDTAGLRAATDEPERVGVARAKAMLGQAHLVLVVVDVSEPLTPEDQELLTASLSNDKCIVVFNKKDKGEGILAAEREALSQGFETVLISALLGEGLEQLEEKMYNYFCSRQGFSLDAEAVITSSRQRQALERSKEALLRARESLERRVPLDCVAIDLKAAVLALGEITGEEVTDEVLDQVFSAFCVGK